MTAYDHQDLPIDALLEELDLGPEVAPATLMRHVARRAHTRGTVWRCPAFGSAPSRSRSELRVGSPLALDADGNGDTLRLQWIYMTEMFDAATVQLLADQFQRVLRGVGLRARHPGGRGRPRRSPRSARRRRARRPTGPTRASSSCFSAAPPWPRSPRRWCTTASRPATGSSTGPPTGSPTGCGRSGSAGTNRWASSSTARPDSPRPSWACSKAGGGYLPIDPAYPPERIAGMLADAGARGAGHPGRAGVARHRADDGACGGRCRRSRRRPGGRRPDPMRAGVRGVHIGLDRSAQGRHDRAPVIGDVRPRRRGPARARRRRPVPPVRLAQLRCAGRRSCSRSGWPGARW